MAGYFQRKICRKELHDVAMGLGAVAVLIACVFCIVFGYLK